jgi:hypothetical protein
MVINRDGLYRSTGGDAAMPWQVLDIDEHKLYLEAWRLNRGMDSQPNKNSHGIAFQTGNGDWRVKDRGDQFWIGPWGAGYARANIDGNGCVTCTFEIRQGFDILAKPVV